MGLFSSSTEKSVMSQYPNNPDITRQSGSGAEQDRYGSHFAASTEKIEQGINYGVDKLKDAAKTKGSGAEQDRYENYFSPSAHSLDSRKVQEAAKAIMNRARGATDTTSTWGLGHDGQQRVKMMTGGHGSGAEQVCCVAVEHGRYTNIPAGSNGWTLWP
jgi:hypothetical protein